MVVRLWVLILIFLVPVAGWGVSFTKVRKLRAALKEAQKAAKHWFSLYCMVRDLSKAPDPFKEDSEQ